MTNDDYLFSAISLNWRGHPLDSFETMMNYIITTTDKSGLKVDAVRVIKQYETGIKISKQQMKNLNLVYGEELPYWNYDIYPIRHKMERFTKLFLRKDGKVISVHALKGAGQTDTYCIQYGSFARVVFSNENTKIVKGQNQFLDSPKIFDFNL
ncbi:MAG: hypothetical protein OXF84_06700 [Bacteroidetes bacterium]|nr:hypothetical protein [Bacteroidota bacterium]